jgi:hypothetical protein
LFFNSEAVPPRSPARVLESSACRRQTIDDLAYIGIANVESQMMRDRARGTHWITAVAVAK